MRGPTDLLQRFADGLASGLLTPAEVASAVLEVLAESSDHAGLWAGASPSLREAVVKHLGEVGAANVPPVFWIGPGEPDPAKRAAHTTLRRKLAAELLGTFAN